MLLVVRQSRLNFTSSPVGHGGDDGDTYLLSMLLSRGPRFLPRFTFTLRWFAAKSVAVFQEPELLMTSLLIHNHEVPISQISAPQLQAR